MASPTIHEPPPGCEVEDCLNCRHQYLTIDTQLSGKAEYHEQISDADAGVKLERILGDITTSRANLSHILQQHGDVILARWKKKSTQWRRQKLEACGLMFGGDSAESSPGVGQDLQAANDTQWWPRGLWTAHLSETMARDYAILPLLLHLRSNNPLSSLALSDMKGLHLAFASPDLSPGLSVKYNPKCVSLREQDYGDLVDYDTDLSHSWAIAGFPRAFMMLEVQQDILSFLVDVASKVADNSTSTGSSKWLDFKPVGINTTTTLAIWGTTFDVSPACSPPATFDIKELLNMAEAQLNYASDEMWLCQTEPVYMKRAIRERKMIGKIPNGALWEQLAATFVEKMYDRLGMWHTILDACRDVHAALEDVRTSEQLRLSESAEESMRALTHKLQGYMKSHSYLLNASATSAAFREFDTAVRDVENLILAGPGSSVDPEYYIRRQAILLAVLQELPSMQDPYAFCCFLSRVQGHLEDRRVACRVDSRLMDHISDLFVINEMVGCCQYNQIGYSVPSPHDTCPECNPTAESAMVVSKQAAKHMGNLLQSFYNTPLPSGRKDYAWFAKASDCQSKLAQFWESARKEIRRAEAANGLAQRATEDWFSFDSGCRSDLEQERLDWENAEAAVTLARIKAKQRYLEPATQDIWGDRTNGAIPIRRKKTKAKSQRETSSKVSSREPTDQSMSESLPEEALPRISVNQDSLQVLRQMYSAAEGNGDVEWQRFARAMVDAGCTVNESAGSAVSFSLGTGRMCVHKRHPDPTVDAIMLHGIGRRLRKWFGWDTDRFVLREKREDIA